MCGSRLQRVVLLVSFLVAAGATPDAAAQLGKLKKALGDKATDSGTTAACLPNRPATPVQSVNLTAAQMAAINAGLDAEITAAPAAFEEADRQQKASEKEAREYEKARAEYEKRYEKYQACADKVATEDAATSEELNQRAGAAGEGAGAQVDEEAMQRLAERAAAAAERVSQGKGTAEDRQTMAEFQRMMGGVQAAGAHAAAAQQEAAEHERGKDARVQQACGAPPAEPAPPPGAPLAGDRIRGAGANAARAAAGGAADLSDRDYNAWREELIALAMSNAVVKPSDKVSQEQADAMNQQIKDTGNKICDMKKAGVPI